MVLDVVALGLDRRDADRAAEDAAAAAQGLPPPPRPDEAGNAAEGGAVAAAQAWMPPPGRNTDVSVSKSAPTAVDAFRRVAEDGGTGDEALAAAFGALREAALRGDADQGGEGTVEGDEEEVPEHVRAMMAEMGLFDTKG